MTVEQVLSIVYLVGLPVSFGAWAATDDGKGTLMGLAVLSALWPVAVLVGIGYFVGRVLFTDQDGTE